MKIILLIDHGVFKARDIIRQIAQTPQQNVALSLEDVAKRCRVIDALDRQQGDMLRLEDADWDTLSRAADTFPYGVAHPDLLRVVKAIKEAKEAAHALKEA